jgi:hypothetical protein
MNINCIHAHTGKVKLLAHRIKNECDMLIAFWDGQSKGTKGTIEIAEKMEIPFEVIMDE